MGSVDPYTQTVLDEFCEENTEGLDRELAQYTLETLFNHIEFSESLLTIYDALHSMEKEFRTTFQEELYKGIGHLLNCATLFELNKDVSKTALEDLEGRVAERSRKQGLCVRECVYPEIFGD